MATRLYLRGTAATAKQTGVPEEYFRDLLQTAGASLTSAIAATTAGGTLIQVGYSITPAWRLLGLSERIAAEVTISGNITVNVWAKESLTSVHAMLRVTLAKITAGGSDVETEIGRVDMTAELTTTLTAYTLTITPSVPVTLGPNERCLLRFYAIPAPSLTMGASGSGVTIQFGAASGTGFSWIEFTEAVTFKANGNKLFLRRTTANGIGNFFDALETRGGSAFTTGIVNTAASGTQIQWTRTAGGTVLEWVTPRLKAGFRWENYTGAQGSFNLAVANLVAWGLESNALANAKLRVQMFRRRGSAETICWTTADSPSGELAVAASMHTIVSNNAGAVTQTDFLPDDRIVIRLYITNVGTMASGFTCTVDYDHNVADANGDSYVVMVYHALEFKAESDPAEPSRIADGGLPMSGIGN